MEFITISLSYCKVIVSVTVVLFWGLSNIKAYADMT